jgi:hypothetical protein
MIPERADRTRPRRADVADSYDRGADAYEALWSPVILPPAAALVRHLGLTGRCVVAEVGAGTGALLSLIRSAAPDVRVVALDASAGMPASTGLVSPCRREMLTQLLRRERQADLVKYVAHRLQPMAVLRDRPEISQVRLGRGDLVIDRQRVSG